MIKGSGRLRYILFVFIIFITLSLSDFNSAAESGNLTARKPIHYMLDFGLNDFYVLNLFENDSVIVVIDDGVVYKFNISVLKIYDHIVFDMEKNLYILEWGERGYFDFDNDGKFDLEISFSDKQVMWKRLGSLKDEFSLFPSFEREDEKSIKFSLNSFFGRPDNLTLVVWSSAIILIILIFYFMRGKKTKKELNEM